MFIYYDTFLTWRNRLGIGADVRVAMPENGTPTKARMMSRPCIAKRRRMRFHTAASGG